MIIMILYWVTIFGISYTKLQIIVQFWLIAIIILKIIKLFLVTIYQNI